MSAAQFCPEITLLGKRYASNLYTCVFIFSLQDILVNKDFEDIFKQVKEQLPNIKMKHGGMEPPQKPKAKVHPMVKLMNYIEKNNLKLIDFFSQLDKDGSMCISYDEFEQGLEVIINC